MNDLIGFIAISLVFFITLLFAFRWKAVSKILLVAFFIGQIPYGLSSDNLL